MSYDEFKDRCIEASKDEDSICIYFHRAKKSKGNFSISNENLQKRYIVCTPKKEAIRKPVETHQLRCILEI